MTLCAVRRVHADNRHHARRSACPELFLPGLLSLM